MIGEKLLSILQTLSKVERNRFRKYLLSPYLNDQPDLVLLFEVCDKALRDPAFGQLEQKLVWQKLYPKKPYNDTQLRRLCSDLNQMALRFLSAEARSQNPLDEALDLQRLLEKPELKKHLAGVERNISRLLEKVPGQSIEYYLAQFNLNNNISNKASKHFSSTAYAEKISSADFYLECFYLTQKLQLYIGWLLYQGSRVTEKHLELPPGFWEQVRSDRFQKIPLLLVYCRVVDCLSQLEQESHFQNLLADLRNYSRDLAEEDLQECYQIAQNYCALKINQGKTSYYRDAFLIFKDMIEQSLLLKNQQLSEGVFKNIVTASLRVNEFDWAEKFIENYIEYLPVSHRENARTFNLANLYSHQKKHHKVIELLQNVEYSDVAYALSAKIILLRTYYELGEFLVLDSLIDSFKIFLRRNKLISKTTKIEFNNLLIFTKKLSILSLNLEKESVTRLRTRIISCNSVSSKKWLLEKIDELQKY